MKKSATHLENVSPLARWSRRSASMLALAGVFALGAPAQAQVTPPQFTQEGRLLKSDGTPVNASVELTFRLYDASTDGALVWEQVQQVTATDGFYVATLGGVDNPLDAQVLGTGNVWLAMAVDGGEEMSPRQQLNSVPYAIVAQHAESVADGAVTSASIAPGAIKDGNISSVDWTKINNVPADLAGGGASLDERYASHQAAGWFFEAESTSTASLNIGSNVDDASASNAKARAALASATPTNSGEPGRVWGVLASDLGASIANGPVRATVRTKVTNTGSSQTLANLKCASMRAGVWSSASPVAIVPSEFPANNAWKEFVIYCDFAPDDEDQFIGVEDFVVSITDLYIDYARIVPLSSVPYITGDHIAEQTIQARNMATSSVDTRVLADGSVSSAKLASGAVGTAQLANGGVTGAKIASGAVGNAQLANSAVTGAKIANGAIGNAQLANGAVTGAKIASGAVGNAQLANNAVTGAKIAGNTINSDHVTQIGVETYGCTTSGYVNNYDAPVNYTCPGNMVLKGVYSVHNNGNEDRRFRYQCCSLRLVP